jgi:glycosyltransferase involved in cell wall biosynthesis
VRVFAGETYSKSPRYSTSDDEYEGIRVRRIRLTAEDFDARHANFSHPAVERSFKTLCEAFRPDVVHCHNLIGLSVTIVRLAREAGARTVVTLHDYWGFCLRNTAMRAAGGQCRDAPSCPECQQHLDDGRGRRIPMRMRHDYFRLFADDVDAFVSPSRYLAQRYVEAGYPESRMHVLWNGIDVERFARVRRKPSPHKLRLSFVGHFGHHKGVHTLLEALLLAGATANVELNLVGEGEERPQYERWLAAHGCGQRVRFWGKIDNSRMEEVYAQTDVLVLPSIWPENQPVSITEAMASSCPVIASDMGGSGELIVDGVTGFLFKAGDASDLADRIARFVDDPSLADRMGEDGRRRVAPFSFASQVRELLRIYSTCRSQRTGGTQVVACIGDRVAPVTEQAQSMLRLYCAGRDVDVTMSEWLTPEQLSGAIALWVVDPAAPVAQTLDLAARHGLPLIVPAAHEGLARACRDAHCGLVYANAEEAAAGVAYLLDHERERASLTPSATPVQQ